MLRFKVLLLIAFLLPVFSWAQSDYPKEVVDVLIKTKQNRGELEKAINYFIKERDKLKLQAIYFLVKNMDIHYSETYNWVDSSKKVIPFNELEYSTFENSLHAFDSLKRSNSKLRAKPIIIYDIDTIKGDYLIRHVNWAFLLWKQTPFQNLSFDDFCEYLLPYRINNEPLQDWTEKFAERFGYLKNYLNGSTDSLLLHLKTDINKWFTCTYNLERRNEPLPRLGALQLLLRKKGSCEDVADLTVFSLRSIGIPASIDVVPFWATSTGSHTLNAVFDSKNRVISYDMLLLYDSLQNFIREPSKVLRTTYSKKTNTLPYFEKKENIPYGFLRLTNYIDVTDKYWPTKDVTCKLYNDTVNHPIIYSCVVNGLKWQPAWWGVASGDSVVFKNMCKGAVFLPMYYKNGRLYPAGSPIASGYNHTAILEPSTETRTIHIREQEHYLLFRPGKKYKLYYWKNSWIQLEEKTAENNAAELEFKNVPKNALLLLVPEYSQGKERPFIVTDDGLRVWW